MVKSRNLLPALAGAALTIGLVSAPALAQTTVKIGVVSTFSGPTEQQGKMLNLGYQLYYKLHQNDVPGVKVEIIERDDTGNFPDTAKRLAQELVTRDHVNILTGFVWSPTFMSVAPIATEAKVPVLSMNAAAIQAVGMSPFMVRDSFTLTQQAFPLGTWTAKKGYKKAYTAVSDYAPGKEAAEAFSKSFTAAGGQIVGQLNFPAPPNTPDFAPFMQRIKDAKPDVVYIFVPAGPQATSIMKTAKDLDFAGAGITLISTEDLVPDEELANIGDQAIGLVTSGIYTSDATRPANKAFVAAWDKEYGTKIPPNFESADAWDGMHMIFDLIAKTKGKFTGEEAIDYLKHWKTDQSPRGTVLIDPETRQVVQNIYMRKVEKVAGKLVDNEFETLGLMNAQGVPYVAAK